MRHWTLEERQRQAELIRTWKPWEKSTGAKTAKGKVRSRMNAQKHGGYSAIMKELKKVLGSTKAYKI